jgi:LysM repeat protein
MKKLILFIPVLIFSIKFCVAQSDMIIRKGDKGFYIEHKVTAKENFYSIGRLYNTPPKEMAAYNKLDMSKGLGLGQVIQIPLAANFSQSVDAGTPVYYKVGEKEGLIKVSTAANNVSLGSLRKWNRLENDKINFGDKLIVGYLISPSLTTTTPTEIKETVVAEKKEPVVSEKKEEPVVKENKEKSIESKEPAAVKEIIKEKPAPVNSGDGYFKESFVKQIKLTPLSKNETVTSGIFKTTSGWQDAKYYMLISGISPGTIVKVINPTNNKIVYAKVLGEMSGIPQNEGYKIRISNAAASALNIQEDDKFIVKINY